MTEPKVDGITSFAEYDVYEQQEEDDYETESDIRMTQLEQ